MTSASYKIAAVQIASVFLNREGTVEKACRYLREAAQAGAQLVVFPEALIPGYPDWVWTLPAREPLTGSARGCWSPKLLREAAYPSAGDLPHELARPLGRDSRCWAVARSYALFSSSHAHMSEGIPSYAPRS